MHSNSTDSTRPEYATYWITRDEDSTGKLSDMVDVWTTPPALKPDSNGGLCWIGEGEAGLASRYAQWTIATAQSNCYVVPDAVRQCIRVGRK